MNTLEVIKALVSDNETAAAPAPTTSFWVIGKNYFMRTVTYALTGKLVEVSPTEIVLVDAAWIADTDRYADSMKSGEFREVEPYPDGQLVLVNRTAIVDATTIKTLPREQK